MWHHAMVSIDEAGKGVLYVDGVAQKLLIDVGTDELDPGTYDKGTEVGSSFTTAWYPNKCIPAAPSGARRLRSTSADLDATTDEPLLDFTFLSLGT